MKRIFRSLGALGSTSLVLVVVIAGTGCRVVKTTASVPERTVAAIFPGGKAEQPEPAELQQSLMRLADTYTGETMQSVDELVGVAGSPFSQRGALEFKLACSTAAIAVATEENPYAAMLDMVSLVTLTRMTLEYHQNADTNGALFDRWVRRANQMESNVWALASQVLAQEQQDTLRRSIEEYYATNVELRDAFLVHPLRMATALPRTMKTRKQSGGLFDLSAFEPFAGLDPAVREVTEARLFAERAMYTVQRIPWTLRSQIELLLLDATAQPQVAKALEDASQLTVSVDRASRAAETISRTAEALPAQISAEREAIMAALQEQQGQLSSLMNAGTEFSDSLTITITNFNALMRRFGVGEPRTNAAPAAPGARSFDILDYAKMAEQLSTMAGQLNETINELNAAVDSPALQKLSTQATSDARGLMNHAFLLVAGLAVLVLVCALIYRTVARRRPSS